MGTRADFYVGVGPQAEWLGSIAWDGNPDGIGDRPRGEAIVRADYGRHSIWSKEDIEAAVQSDRAQQYGQHILIATNEAAYRQIVADYVTARGDGTLPERGWPWPWDTSATTDYAYFFVEGKVLASSFGHGLFDPLKPEPSDEDEDLFIGAPPEMPDMSARKNVRFDKGSGLLILKG